MNHDMKIIIGSGLAGPLLAIYLSQREYSVQLYEKRPDLRVENISVGRSINLALSHRGIKAMKSANVFDKLNAPQVQFISKSRALNWLPDDKFSNISISKYKGISWRISGTKL